MLVVETFPLGMLETNCYLLHDNGQAVAVDPGGDPSSVLAYLGRNNLQLTHILNTHFHFDHTMGNAPLSKATGAPILGSPKDDFLLQNEMGRGGYMGLPSVRPFEYEPIEPGETSFMGHPCHVLSTPGHSPGSLSFYFPEDGELFSGDLLFYRSIGRSDFAGGDYKTLLQAVESSIFTLPSDTVVRPGHGVATTVGDEMLHNPFFSAFQR